MTNRNLTGLLPNRHGRFGSFGGRYVPETLMPALLELEREYAQAKKDRRFQAELSYYLHHYVGRPTPVRTPPHCRPANRAGTGTRAERRTLVALSVYRF